LQSDTGSLVSFHFNLVEGISKSESLVNGVGHLITVFIGV